MFIIIIIILAFLFLNVNVIECTFPAYIDVVYRHFVKHQPVLQNSLSTLQSSFLAFNQRRSTLSHADVKVKLRMLDCQATVFEMAIGIQYLLPKLLQLHHATLRELAIESMTMRIGLQNMELATRVPEAETKSSSSEDGGEDEELFLDSLLKMISRIGRPSRKQGNNNLPWDELIAIFNDELHNFGNLVVRTLRSSQHESKVLLQGLVNTAIQLHLRHLHCAVIAGTDVLLNARIEPSTSNWTNFIELHRRLGILVIQVHSMLLLDQMSPKDKDPTKYEALLWNLRQSSQLRRLLVALDRLEGSFLFRAQLGTDSPFTVDHWPNCLLQALAKLAGLDAQAVMVGKIVYSINRLRTNIRNYTTLDQLCTLLNKWATNSDVGEPWRSIVLRAALGLSGQTEATILAPPMSILLSRSPANKAIATAIGAHPIKLPTFCLVGQDGKPVVKFRHFAHGQAIAVLQHLAYIRLPIFFEVAIDTMPSLSCQHQLLLRELLADVDEAMLFRVAHHFEGTDNNTMHNILNIKSGRSAWCAWSDRTGWEGPASGQGIDI